MLAVLLLGYASGLPLKLVGSTLKVWMRKEELGLGLIGMFLWLQLPYSLKFLWAPIIDRFIPPFFDRRRGWILICNLLLAGSLVALGVVGPGSHLTLFALAVFFVSFFSASQDIVIDAYRREVLPNRELGLGSALAINGYRIGMLAAGAGALLVADSSGWPMAYMAMAASLILVGSLGIFIGPSIETDVVAPRSLREAVVGPFKEFFQREGALEILAFIFLYKIGEQMAAEYFDPFYVDMQFTLTEIAWASKVFGFWAVIGGGILGGVAVLKIGYLRALAIFGVMQSLGLLGFTVLANTGHSLVGLAAVVTIENLFSGMATSAYAGFMASLCDRRFTATQYALLSSFMGAPRILFGGTGGFIAERTGWPLYFVFCTLLTIPGLLMLFRARRWKIESV